MLSTFLTIIFIGKITDRIIIIYSTKKITMISSLLSILIIQTHYIFLFPWKVMRYSRYLNNCVYIKSARSSEFILKFYVFYVFLIFFLIFKCFFTFFTIKKMLQISKLFTFCFRNKVKNVKKTSKSKKRNNYKGLISSVYWLFWCI